VTDLVVRAIRPDEARWFATLDGGDVHEALTGSWEDGDSSPAWALVAEAGGRAIARGALVTSPLGGGIATLEGTAAFLWTDPTGPDEAGALAAVVDGLADRLRPHGPTTLDRRLNPELHADVPRMRRLVEAAGFGLFQEKVGLAWTPDVPTPPGPQRIRIRTFAEVGPDGYGAVMAAATAGTLDRNDRYYIARCGPAAWAEEMLGFREPEDSESWLVGETADRVPIGYVAVSAFDDAGTWTIAHIGVVPEARGRGHVDDLLAAADLAARGRGFTVGLSDVDADNAPMLAAMARAGHRSDLRPWHIWHYRREVPGP
jgi:ribosomal protein S18 acetylase RimI-like enzyme